MGSGENTVPGHGWRADAFRRASRLYAILALPAAIVFALLSATPELHVMRVTAYSMLGVFVLVAILSGDPRRYRILATVQLCSLIAACVILIAVGGLLPGAAVALASSVVFAGLLLSSRAAWVATAVTTLLLVAVGAAVRAGLLHPADPRSTLDWSRMDVWLRLGAGYFVPTAAVAATVTVLIDRLERGLRAERDARESAQRALGARQEFLVVAAHELRTPVTSLQLAVQVLVRRARQGRLVEAERPSLERMLDLVARQATSLSSLVDTLLDVSRIDDGSLHVVLSDVDLADAVTTAVAHLSEPLCASGSELTLDVHAPIVGHWDRARVEQVVTNLLSNAIKYGEGKPIEIRAAAQDGVARLVVQDHGMGIPPEEVQRIFGRFERAVSSRHYGGLGLGLYVVQRIVERLGGTLECESTFHEGSTFIVTVPRGRVASRQPGPGR
jgi:signal transduction histidine kinase